MFFRHIILAAIAFGSFAIAPSALAADCVSIRVDGSCPPAIEQVPHVTVMHDDRRQMFIWLSVSEHGVFVSYIGEKSSVVRWLQRQLLTSLGQQSQFTADHQLMLDAVVSDRIVPMETVLGLINIDDIDILRRHQQSAGE